MNYLIGKPILPPHFFLIIAKKWVSVKAISKMLSRSI